MQAVTPISLSIVIVNYRSAQLVMNCIESIVANTNGLAPEIIIVDNSSDKNERDLIQTKFPFIKWVEMNYNSGFSRANNEGIKNASAEVILLLNPDVIFDDNSLEKCFERFIRSGHAACTVQLLNPGKSPQISGGYFITGGLNHLLPLPVLGKIFKALGVVFGVKKTSVKNTEDLREVDWINGAFIMTKKEIVQKAGYLDEDFFLYAEEIEWCSRIRKSGKICIYGDLHAIHLQGESANQAFGSSGKGYYNLYDKKGRQIMISNFLRIRKQFGAGWFLFHLLVYLAEIPFFFLLAIISTIFFSRRYNLAKFGGYISNLFALLALSPKMLGNKPHFYKVI